MNETDKLGFFDTDSMHRRCVLLSLDGLVGAASVRVGVIMTGMIRGQHRLPDSAVQVWLILEVP